jgi:hypothetical protein
MGIPKTMPYDYSTIIRSLSVNSYPDVFSSSSSLAWNNNRKGAVKARSMKLGYVSK